MSKTVNKEIIENWISSNGPNGLARLALNAGVSTSLIQKALYYDRIPKMEYKRQMLASAIGVSESVLFPVSNHGEEAS